MPMLSIIHGTAGAFIASVVPDAPLIYLPTSFALHYLGDAIPHWDIGTGIRSGKRKKFTAAALEVADLIITFLVVFFLWQKTMPDFTSGFGVFFSQINWPIWLGCLAGILPDILEAPRTFFNWHPRLLQPLMRFHQKIHQSTIYPFWGLLPQFLILGSIIFLAIKMQNY